MLKSLSQWIFPNICCLCSHYSTTGRDLCSTCYALLPWIVDRCYRCGLPLDAVYPGTESIHCLSCQQSPPPFDRLCSVFSYEAPITKITTGLKFGKCLAYGAILGEIFAEKVMDVWYKNTELPEVIIPVPLHEKRLRSRGFNQSVELLDPLLKRYSIPMLLDVCTRTRKTPPQSQLNKQSRKRNLKNAFQIATPYSEFPYEHIAIMDDVVTTGSTVKALSHLFKDAGVQQIDIWCICRT